MKRNPSVNNLGWFCGPACLVSVGFLLAGPAAHAADRFWTGASGNGYWSEPSNWSPTGPPQNGDALTFPHISTNSPGHILTNDVANLHLDSMTFNGYYETKGDVLWLANGITVNDTAELPVRYWDLIHLTGLQNFVAHAGLGVDGLDMGSNPLSLIVDANVTLEVEGYIQGAGPISTLGDGTVLFVLYPLPLYPYQGQIFHAGRLLELDVYSSLGTNQFAGFSPSLITVGGGVVTTSEIRWLQPHEFTNHPALTLYANGVVNLNNNNEDFGAVTFNGGEVDTGTGQFAIYQPLTVNPSASTAVINGNLGLPACCDGTFIVGDGSADCDLIVNAQIFGDAPYLRKQGPGKMCLMTGNTYAGVTLLQEGILYVNNSTGLSSAGVVISGGAATLQLDGSFFPTLANNFEMSGSGVGGTHGALEAVGYGGNVALTGALLLDAATTVNVAEGAGLQLDGAISGPGSLTKLGTGTLSLGGSDSNTFSGSTVVSQGTLLLNKPNAISAVPGALGIGDGASSAIARNLNSYQIFGNIYVYAGGLMDINGEEENVDFFELYGSGAVQTGFGYLGLKTGGDIDVYPADNGAPASITGNISLDPGNHHLNVGSGSSSTGLVVYAAMSQYSSAASIEKTGAGVLRLSGNNTFTGSAIVSGGTLIAGSPGALSINGNTFVNNGATLALDGGIAMNLETLVLNSSNSVALQSLSGSNTWTGPIGLGQPTGISVSPAGGYLQVLNSVSGSGGLTKLGPGTLQFWGSAANVYVGTTTVSQGVLEVARVSQTSVPGDMVVGDDTTSTTTATLRTLREQQFSPTANLNVHHSGLFDLHPYPGAPVPTPALRTVVGNGLVNLGGGSNGISSLSVSNDLVCAFAGVISGSGAFNKRGAALMQLTGNNTYTGDTTISAGTLQVDGSQPQSLVQNSGRLQGSGTVGAINLNSSSAVVAPGDSPGILTCSSVSPTGTGNNGRGSLEMELNGPAPGTGYDQLNVHGTVTLNSRITLNASLNFSSSLSNTFTIISNDGTDPVVGTFLGLAQNATLTIGSEQFQISYTGGDGNDVVLTQISGAPLPTLALATISPGAITLSWPTNGPAFTLQSSTNLSSSTWATVTPGPVIVGANYVATNATIGAQKFFRLVNP